MPSSTWTMEECGAKRVEMVGVNDKHQLTAVFCGSLTGDFFPCLSYLQRKDPTVSSSLHISTRMAHHPFPKEQTMVEYVEHIIVPYIDKVREPFGDEAPALVIMDNFKGQVTEAFLDLLDTNNIHVCLLPQTQPIVSNQWIYPCG